MQNDLTLKYYSFFVHFNPSQRQTEWGKIAAKAQSYYVDFLNKSDYGNDLMSTTFNFLVEKEIDFDKQNDNISTSSYLGIPKTARLTLHFDYDKFTSVDEHEKLKLTLNGILFLLNHWNSNLKVPNGNPISTIIADFSETLNLDSLLLSEQMTSKTFIKLTNPFRFNFMRHHFQGLTQKQILFDTNHIEQFLNNQLHKSDFGKSINKIYFSYDIFSFDNNQTAKNFIDNEKKYQYGKDKDLSFMEQFDSERFLYNKEYEEQTKLGQVEYLHKGLLNAILRIKEMKRKPKDFNVDKFYADINSLMTDYEEHYCR